MKLFERIKKFFTRQPPALPVNEKRVRDFNRGDLIKFRVISEGRTLGGWDGIWHGDGKVHSVGKSKHDPWLMDGLRPIDKVTKIKHGVLIERFIP